MTSIFNVSVVYLLNVLFWSPTDAVVCKASVKDLRFQPRGVLVFKLFSLG